MGRIWREAPGMAHPGVLGPLRDWYRRRVLRRDPRSRHAWLDRAPYAWRVLRTREHQLEAWLVIGTATAMFLLSAATRHAPPWEDSLPPLDGFACQWLKVLCAIGSIEGSMREGRSGALELLAATPPGIAGVWRQHFRGLMLSYRWSVGWMASVALVASVAIESLDLFDPAFLLCATGWRRPCWGPGWLYGVNRWSRPRGLPWGPSRARPS